MLIPICSGLSLPLLQIFTSSIWRASCLM
uniref:Uncharacterized protein n=1 Tax=Anguilla anguilla TaxID=7936 RepID=A0A0E9P6J6_ANGAN